MLLLDGATISTAIPRQSPQFYGGFAATEAATWRLSAVEVVRCRNILPVDMPFIACRWCQTATIKRIHKLGKKKHDGIYSLF